ncbi:MAG: FeoB-associated Cys-rich membrane protein [Candidatus Methanomethylophilus sp.]|jgi:hypothetical protein|nr:FeoB-associated Cys-rich membrane protein [Methanomethylophilus sp.]MCI2093406.1 FeoB-associated Cys-rich membrane protein [Methanomethylophilus sp.]MEE3400631.1 FeoB-associated Cys-rich membrane protein [Methanomethylophilus sp.]WII09230.1 FeoB-associated Cys-rich membrane protein [Methanomassiliicoccales archaeon LGM-DZ1]
MTAGTAVVLVFVIALVAWLSVRTYLMAKKDLKHGCCGDCAKCRNPINCRLEDRKQ